MALVALDPAIASGVAHLWGVDVLDVLAGRVAGRPSAERVDLAGIEVSDDELGGTPVRLYRPAGRTGPLPALVWVHGGGWRYGGLDMAEAHNVAERVAHDLPAVVVSVDYRLAPAHPHPAGRDDVRAALDAVLAGDVAGVDADRVALGGGSAGAHLAMLAVLDAPDAPSPRATWLAYPVTDPVLGPWAERHPDCPPAIWTGSDALGGMFAAYVPDAGDRPADGLAPTRHPALGDLPPALVTLAEVDGLRAQAEHFVHVARAAGVAVDVHDVAGVLHGYLDTVPAEPHAVAALARHIDWLRDALT